MLSRRRLSTREWMFGTGSPEQVWSPEDAVSPYAPSPVSVWDGWRPGWDAAKHWPVVPITDGHIGIFGRTGAGKTVLLETLLGTLGLDPQVNLWLTDLSDGPVIGRFEELAYVKNGRRMYGAGSPEQVLHVAEAFLADMHKAIPRLKHRADEELQVKRGDRINYLVLDEAEQAWEDDEIGPRMKKITDLIVGQGRKAGYFLEYAIRRPSLDNMSVHTRVNTGSRLIGVVADTRTSNIAFGYEADAQGFDASQIETELTFYVKRLRDRRPFLIRAPWNDAKALKKIVQAGLVVRNGGLS